jgi:hypothetical protein
VNSRCPPTEKPAAITRRPVVAIPGLHARRNRPCPVSHT